MAPPTHTDLPPTRRADTQATWSLIFGVASLFCGVFTGLPALILGVVARRNHPTSAGETRALIGVVTGGITTLLTIILLAIAVPMALHGEETWYDRIENPTAYDPATIPR